MSLTYLSSAEHRAREILDAYGSSPASWPAHERQATLDCIAHSPALQQYQVQLADLDRRIQAGQAAALAQHADVHALQQRILDLLPATSCTQEPGIPSFWQRMVGWPDTPRFALALAGLAVFALVMIMPQSQPPGVSPRAAAQYEAWSWYDITGQDLPASNDSTALTMTDLIDLEVDQDGG